MKKILILVIFSITLSFGNHKSYLSLTKINYDTKTKAVQITMSMFIDDVNTALNNRFSLQTELNVPNEDENIDNFLKDYLINNFKISLNSENIAYNYLGKEYVGDLIYLYMEIEDVTALSQLEVFNQLLITDFPDQKNYIKLKINNTHKSLLLTKNEPKGSLEF